ncbi:MAG: DUF3800 domain-containing protein, partial [Candidatus Thorarchaeota archaeon]|nr:DUF3800 domain-containing protein [Candidatus Thorarchaeota archaeon]
MKFCYLDESGTGKEPYAVMAGVIADAGRMHVTKKEWSEALEALSEIVGRPVREIHTADFYAGNGIWRGLDGNTRAKMISAIFNWLAERKHKIVYSAVDKSKYTSEFNNEPHANDISSLWCFMALHICLAIQKHFQGEKPPKGHTALIFDNKAKDAKNLIELFTKIPAWTDTYYNCMRKQDRLNQIIDVPYFGDSRYVFLIQVADFVSYFLRRYIEIQMGVSKRYEDEPSLIESWANAALEQ